VVQQDKLVRSVRQGLREQQVYQGRKAKLEILVKLDCQVMLEIKDSKVLKEIKGSRVLLETKVKLAR